MKKLISLILFALALGLPSAQDIIKPSPPCFNCPEWARNMTQYEWESWQEADAAEKENSKINLKVVPPFKDGLQIGASLIAIGAILDIVALSIVPVSPKPETYNRKAVRGNSGLIKMITITGLSTIAVGGITMAWSF